MSTKRVSISVRTADVILLDDFKGDRRARYNFVYPNTFKHAENEIGLEDPDLRVDMTNRFRVADAGPSLPCVPSAHRGVVVTKTKVG